MSLPFDTGQGKRTPVSSLESLRSSYGYLQSVGELTSLLRSQPPGLMPAKMIRLSLEGFASKAQLPAVGFDFEPVERSASLVDYLEDHHNAAFSVFRQKLSDLYAERLNTYCMQVNSVKAFQARLRALQVTLDELDDEEEMECPRRACVGDYSVDAEQASQGVCDVLDAMTHCAELTFGKIRGLVEDLGHNLTPSAISLSEYDIGAPNAYHPEYGKGFSSRGVLLGLTGSEGTTAADTIESLKVLEYFGRPVVRFFPYGTDNPTGTPVAQARSQVIRLTKAVMAVRRWLDCVHFEVWAKSGVEPKLLIELLKEKSSGDQSVGKTAAWAAVSAYSNFTDVAQAFGTITQALGAFIGELERCVFINPPLAGDAA